MVPFPAEDRSYQDIRDSKDIAGQDSGGVAGSKVERGRHRGGRNCRDELGDFGFVGIANDMSYSRQADEVLWGALRIATGDNNAGGGVRRVDFANGIARLRVSGGGDGAGIQDDEIRRRRIAGQSAPSFEKLALDRRAVGLSGTATELFDKESGHVRGYVNFYLTTPL